MEKMDITDIPFCETINEFGRKDARELFYKWICSRDHLFPTLDDDHLILLLLFDVKDEILTDAHDKFIQAVCAEANIRYKTKKGENLFSYKFEDPCYVPPNDNKLKEDLQKLMWMHYVSSKIMKDPISPENAPRLMHVYTLTGECFINLRYLELNEREAEAHQLLRQLFKDILSESEDWHDALTRYQKHFLEYSNEVKI